MFDIGESKAQWLKDRSKGIGGSDMAVLLDISPFKTQYQLWAEKLGLVESEDISALPHVQRGVQGEKIARMKFEEQTLRNYKPKSWSIPDSPFRCNDDGWCAEDNTFLEIKCMGAKNHELVKEQGHIPEYYLCQCHYNMMVSGAVKCYFISYYPETDDMVVVEVERDEAICEEYKGIVQRWWHDYIVCKVPPSLTSKDKVELKDEESLALAKKYMDVLELKERMDEQVKAVQQELYALTHDKRPSVKVGNLIVTRATRKGAVDYSKVPSLKGVVLDDYRKDPITTTSIRVVKAKD